MLSHLVSLLKVNQCNNQKVRITIKAIHRKRHHNKRDEQIINRHITDNRKAHMEKDDHRPTADDISLGLHKFYHNAILPMLNKHKRM